MASFILVSTVSGTATDVSRSLEEAGQVVRPHALASAPAVDFADVLAAVIDVGDRTEAAAAQTRRWRAELGDELVPILWVIPSACERTAALGLEAGADAVLPQPLAIVVLAAQVRAAVRSRRSGLRLAARASEARLLGEHLQKLAAQRDRERSAARDLLRACQPPRFPERGTVRVSAWTHSPAGGDFLDVRERDGERIGFVMGNLVDRGSAGNALGFFLLHVATTVMDGGGATPGEALTEVNRRLLGVELDERPLAAMLVGTIHSGTGELLLARAGLPSPCLLTLSGEVRSLAVPGAFLGTAPTTYPTVSATLQPGERFVVCTDGAPGDGAPIPGDCTALSDVLVRHRECAGQDFVDAVARDLLASDGHTGGLTLLGVERTGAGADLFPTSPNK